MYISVYVYKGVYVFVYICADNLGFFLVSCPQTHAATTTHGLQTGQG